LRGLEGSRAILLINPADMAHEGLHEGDVVSLVSDAGDAIHREVSGLAVTPSDLPDGCVGGYYPEMNVLVPV
jgi:anaerobic selenocysteine-containing dehydrogenase